MMKGGAFCVGKRVGAVAPYQYKVGSSKLASKMRSFWRFLFVVMVVR